MESAKNKLHRDSKVRISAPARMSLDVVRLFAATKLGWIKKHQAKLRDQQREAPRDFVTRESHYHPIALSDRKVFAIPLF